jgi:hypothetical protein
MVRFLTLGYSFVRAFSVVSYAAILWTYCAELNCKLASVHKYLLKPMATVAFPNPAGICTMIFGLFRLGIRLFVSTTGYWNGKDGENLKWCEVMARVLTKIQVFCIEVKQSEKRTA